MSKLKTTLSVLKQVAENLELVDQFVDVDRLVGLSNAQGGIAKIIRDAVTTLDGPMANTPLNQLPKRKQKKLPPPRKTHVTPKG